MIALEVIKKAIELEDKNEICDCGGISFRSSVQSQGERFILSRQYAHCTFTACSSYASSLCSSGWTDRLLKKGKLPQLAQPVPEFRRVDRVNDWVD